MKLVTVNDIPRDIVSAPVENITKLYKLCQEMADLCEKENGIGLSAPQVGINYNLFVIKEENTSYTYYLNCDYLPRGDYIDSIEGCLSLKNDDSSLKSFLVKRFSQIQVKGFVFSKDELKIDPVSFLTTKNIYNTVFQHEIDHCKGILISDIGTELNVW